MDKGIILHDVERMEIDFMQERLLHPDYSDVEALVEKIDEVFHREVENISDILEAKVEVIEEIRRRVLAMKKSLEAMEKSDLKDSLLSQIEDMVLAVDL